MEHARAKRWTAPFREFDAAWIRGVTVGASDAELKQGASEYGAELADSDAHVIGRRDDTQLA
jgi:hypothetical protein